MRVNQDFINLLNLPKSQLQELVEELDVSVAKGASKWEVVRVLSQVSASKLAPGGSEWFFAGRTSVTYIRLGDGSPLDQDAIIEALTDMADGVNPLEEDIRPAELSSRPSLIDVSLGDDRIFLSFGVQKPVARVLSNFEIKEVHGDEFFVAVIRPEKAIMEVRTNHERASRLATTWITDFSDLLAVDEEEQGEDTGNQVPA